MVCCYVLLCVCVCMIVLTVYFLFIDTSNSFSLSLLLTHQLTFHLLSINLLSLLCVCVCLSFSNNQPLQFPSSLPALILPVTSWQSPLHGALLNTAPTSSTSSWSSILHLSNPCTSLHCHSSTL